MADTDQTAREDRYRVNQEQLIRLQLASIHEREETNKLYEIKLKQRDRKMNVVVSASGVIMAVSTKARLKSLPRALAESIRKKADGTRSARLERVEVRAVEKSGKIVTLLVPRIVYKSVLLKVMQAQMTVAEDGTMVDRPKWRTIHRDDDDEDEDDDDDDDEDDEDDD